MASLSAFLHPELPSEQEIVISDRFKENGEPVPFRIKPLTQEEVQALSKKYTKTTKSKTGIERHIDTDRFTAALIVASTTFPDFSDAELCKAYGTMDPLQVPAKMLLAGEFMKLNEAIMALSGMDDESEAEEAEEAKNF